MTNTHTEDADATIAQILRLEEAGCEIIRSTVPTLEAAEAFAKIKKNIHIPIVADIHFDYRMALAAMENGADAIRINPGNIGGAERIKAVVDMARERQIPIRVGVNSGSLEKEIVQKYGRVTAEGLVESALDKVRIIEELGYDQMVISIKSSDVLMCIRAHELIAEQTDYPLHVGITEAGTKRILQTLGLRRGNIEVVSCPTCGRTQIDLISLANNVERLVEGIPLDIKVAVMGCVVNGPGEAAEADLGICGGKGMGLLIRHGEIIRKVPESELLGALEAELRNWIGER